MIVYFIEQAVLFMLLSLPFIIVVRFVFHRFEKRKLKELNWHHEIGVIVLFIVFAVIASQTIIPSGADANYVLINLVPFTKISEIKDMVRIGDYGQILREVVGNVVSFVPIGFLLPLLWKRFEKIWVVLICCLSISLAIEVIQLGISLRATDVDDLMMNTLGGIIGYLAYVLIRKLTKSKTDNFRLAEKEPVAIG